MSSNKFYWFLFQEGDSFIRLFFLLSFSFDIFGVFLFWCCHLIWSAAVHMFEIYIIDTEKYKKYI